MIYYLHIPKYHLERSTKVIHRVKNNVFKYFRHSIYLVLISRKKLHHEGRNPAILVPVASSEKGGALDGRGADTAVCKKKKTTETNHERS